jgi:hypothetical protein
MSASPVDGHICIELFCIELWISVGDTIDFMLSPKRGLTAAKLFLRFGVIGKQ